MMHTETIDPDDILKITKTRADIETKKKSIEDRKLALIKRSNSHKKLESYSTVFYVLATVATIAVTAVTSFFPVFTTILNLLRDALVALPNLVAGTLWGVSISSSKKENLTKEKLKEQLAKAEDELQELEIQFEQLKNKKQIGTWWEAIEKQQDELQELEVQLDQLKNKNQIERPQTELSELSPAETGKKSSENHQLQDPEQDPKLITEKAKLKEIQGKLDENKKYKSSQRRWAIFSALFYIAAAAVMFSPLGPVLLAVGLTTALVVAALSLTGAICLTGSFYYAKKGAENKRDLKNELAKQTEKVAALREELIQQQECKQVDSLKAAISSQQMKIIELKAKLDPGKKSEGPPAIFSEIDRLNKELHDLKSEKKALKNGFKEREEKLLEQDAKYKSSQKILGIASGIFYALAAAVIIFSVLFPPFGALAIAGIGVAAIGAAVCSTMAGASSVSSAVYFASKRKGIKEQLETISKEKNEKLDEITELEKQKKRELTDKVHSVITAQQKEITQLKETITSATPKLPEEAISQKKHVVDNTEKVSTVQNSGAIHR